MTHNLHRQLGQLSPANTTAVSIYSPASHYITHVNSLRIVNITAGAVVASVFHDDNGTTYNDTTIIWHGSIAADTTVEVFSDIEGLSMDGATSGNLAVKTETNSAFTFTLYGFEDKK